MPELTLPDVTLHYEDEGQGAPVLMIAGTGSDSASWGTIAGPLAQQRRVIRPDNRTTGRTVPWDAPVSVEIWAADAVALLDSLEIDRAHVVGHSLGGTIAAALALAAPGRVRSLALLASAPLALSRNLALFDMIGRLRRADQPPDLWLRAFYPWLFHPALFDRPDLIDAGIAAALDYPHAQSAAAMAHQIDALRQFRPANWQALSGPVMAVLAADDLLIPHGMALAALAGLPGIRIETIADCGHSVHWDKPAAVLAHLTDFWDGLDG